MFLESLTSLKSDAWALSSAEGVTEMKIQRYLEIRRVISHVNAYKYRY
jgi:hypothetical protein